jgi:hypothetical protein
MALTNLETWISDRIEWLTPRHAASLRRAVNADIKEARPTVRAKRPVQQAKVKITPDCGKCHYYSLNDHGCRLRKCRFVPS